MLFWSFLVMCIYAAPSLFFRPTKAQYTNIYLAWAFFIATLGLSVTILFLLYNENVIPVEMTKGDNKFFDFLDGLDRGSRRSGESGSSYIFVTALCVTIVNYGMMRFLGAITKIRVSNVSSFNLPKRRRLF
jgi:hypothetical protein